jgi:hypothetical protein
LIDPAATRTARRTFSLGRGRAMSSTNFVVSRAFSVDDVTYSITVYQFPEGYRAFCDCETCPDHRMKSEAESDKEIAIKSCQLLIREHHQERHQKPTG